MPTHRISIASLVASLLILFSASGQSQSRVEYSGRPLFLSGANVAWVSFAGDLGPGAISASTFRRMFDSVRVAGGNSMRLWLHTNGANTPQFDANGVVIGPGTNALADLRQILDLAQQSRVGLILCLWSFDMLGAQYGANVVARAKLMLTDVTARTAYIQKSLIPMVTAVKGHPGIIAWEVFNEAEGMSNEYGWTGYDHVPMQTIQTFVNVVAGAIHRTDPSAKVSTGAWSFIALSDASFPALTGAQAQPQTLSDSAKRDIEDAFSAHYNMSVPADTILAKFAGENYNYYRDDRLVAAGGDVQGTLDFYMVHYYSWAGTALSPFHHGYAQWKLTKPVVVAEFFAQTTFGVATQNLYRVLYDSGYAGAQTWQWIDNTQQSLTKGLMRDLFSLHRADLEVITSVAESAPERSSSFALEHNYPNPFNPSTQIAFTTTKEGPVSLRVYDILGREVAVLFNGNRNPGHYTERFDGGRVASGVYIYVLRSSEGQRSGRMVLSK